MALQCQFIVNNPTYSAGQTPPPTGAIFIYNPNAVPVQVIGIRIAVATPQDPTFSEAQGAGPEVPIGPGQTTLVPALGSITIGPISFAASSAAAGNAFQGVNQAGNLNPVNPQPAQPFQVQYLLSAIVYGSDGSINQSGYAGGMLSGAQPPPFGFQGGALNFAAPNNFAAGFLAGIF